MPKLCYIFLLHQTTTQTRVTLSARNVVLYLSSTSNHNSWKKDYFTSALCYIFLLHQTTTYKRAWKKDYLLCYIFLLHQTTTLPYARTSYSELCYIFLLHQTTTLNRWTWPAVVLCYIFLLHQTTTGSSSASKCTSCVISFFYIKPQPMALSFA